MNPAPSLHAAMEWTDYPVSASAAHNAVPVRIGVVGSGRPIGVLTAAVHGDEGPWGTLAVNRLLAQTPVTDLRGSLRVVPVAHPLAMEVDARQSDLDLLDLNSSFPGRPDGTHTERLAALLAIRVLDGSDLVLDVHGGGSWNINCFTYRFPGSHEVADWIGAPLVLEGPDRSSSLTGYARARGAKAAWIEVGGRGELEEDRATELTAGLRRALGAAGVLEPIAETGPKPLVARSNLALCTSGPGIYQPVKRERALGTILERDTLIGNLLDPVSSEVLESFRSPFARGMLALLRPTMALVGGPGKVVAVVAEID